MSREPAYDQLRDSIVSGQFQPNERLVEADLSKSLGLSRAAVRTALARLEQDGLVVREPNRGARVRLVNAAEAIEILEAREVLEGVVARHAALNVDDDAIQALRDILAGQRELLDRGDLLRASDQSGVLHARFLDMARHETAARLISMLKSQIVRFQYRTILVPGRPEQAFAEHSAIIDAIAAKDPEQADLAMRRHICCIREALRDHLEDDGTRSRAITPQATGILGGGSR